MMIRIQLSSVLCAALLFGACGDPVTTDDDSEAEETGVDSENDGPVGKADAGKDAGKADASKSEDRDSDEQTDEAATSKTDAGKLDAGGNNAGFDAGVAERDGGPNDASPGKATSSDAGNRDAGRSDSRADAGRSSGDAGGGDPCIELSYEAWGAAFFGSRTEGGVGKDGTCAKAGACHGWAKEGMTGFKPEHGISLHTLAQVKAQSKGIREHAIDAEADDPEVMPPRNAGGPLDQATKDKLSQFLTCIAK